MAKRYQAGTAFIRVTPDFRNFKRQLDKEVKDNLRDFTASVDLDTKGALAKIRELEEGGTANIDTKVDKKALARARKSIDRLTSDNSQALITAEMDTMKARRDLDKLVTRANGQKIDLTANFKIDENSMTREFEKARRKLSMRPMTGKEDERNARNILVRALKADRLRREVAEREAAVARTSSKSEALEKSFQEAGSKGKNRKARSKAQQEFLAERTLLRTELETATQNLESVRGRYERVVANLRRAEGNYARFSTGIRNAHREASALGGAPVARQARRKLTVEPAENVSALDRLNRGVANTRVAKSRLEGDNTALRTAAQAAVAYDRAQTALLRSNRQLEAANYDLAKSQAAVTAHRANDTIASKEGLAALERERKHTIRQSNLKQDNDSLSQVASGARRVYNNSAKRVEDRVDLNPIRRIGETFQAAAGRGIQFFNDRLIFAGRLLSATSSLGMAAGAALAGLGAVNIVPLIGALSGVAGSLAILPALALGAAAAIATIAVGVSGLGDAFKASSALDKAARSASVGTDNSAKNLQNAYKASAKTAAQGAQQIEQAEKGVQRAQKSSVQAQKALSQARKDAKTQLEDLNYALKGIALSEEDAALRVVEAREALTTLPADATPTERARARLSLKQAIADQQDLIRANKRQRIEAADANKKGIEGSEQVVSAADQAKQADEAVIESRQQLAQTQRDVADANADAAERIADAATAAAAGNTTVARAALELDEAMKKLAPNARGFVIGIEGMKSAFQGLKKDVQGALFSDIGYQLREVSEKQIPVFSKGMSGIASEINGGVRHALEYLKTEKSRADFGTIFDRSAKASGQFTRGLSNLVQAFVPLGAVGSDYLPRIAGGFENATRKFAAFIERTKGTGELASWLAGVTYKTREVGRLFNDAGRIIGAVFKGSMQQGNEQLTALGKSAKILADRLNSPEGLARIGDFFKEIRQTFGNLLSILHDVGSVLNNSIIPAFQTVSAVVAPIIKFAANLLRVFDEYIPVLHYALIGFLAFRIVNGIFAKLTQALIKHSATFAAATRAAYSTAAAYRYVGVTGAAAATAHGRVGTAMLAAGQAAGRAVPLLTQMNRTYQNTARASRAFGSQTGRLGSTIAAGAGVARASLTGLRGAASGAMGLLGGPLGAALLVGTVAFAGFSSEAEKSKDLVNKFKESYKDYAESQIQLDKELVKSRGKVNSAVLEQQNKGVGAVLSQVNARAEDKPGFFAKAPRALGIDLFNANQRDEARRTAQEQQKLLADLGLSQSDLAAKTAGTQQEWDAFAQSLRDAGPAGNELLKKLNGMRDNFVEQQKLIQSVSPGYLDLADAIAVIGDKSATASDKVDAFRRRLEALIPGNEEREALAEFSTTIDEITQKLTEVDQNGPKGDAVIDKFGGANTSSANGRQLDDLLKNMTTSLEGIAAAGGDVDGAWMRTNEQLEKVREAFGLTDAQMKVLQETYRLTPTDISTTVNLLNASPVTQSLTAIQEQMDKLGKGPVKNERFASLSKESIKALTDITDLVGGTVTVIDEANGVVDVSVNSQEARDEMDRIVTLAQAFDAIKSTATFDANTKTFNVQAGSAQAIIANLSRLRGTPSVDLLIAGLQENGRVSTDLLRQIQDTNPNPTATLGIQPLLDSVNTAKTALDGLGASAIFGIVSQTPEEAHRKIDSFASSSGGAAADADGNPVDPSKRQAEVSPSPGVFPDGNGGWVNAYGKAVDAQGKLKGGYRGMRIPGFSVGGTMPTSGPGSQVRDGFLAVGPDGRPRARVNGGEWVINDGASRKFNGILGGINEDAPWVQGLAGYATGGVLGAKPTTPTAPGATGQFALAPINNPFAPLADGLGTLGSQFTGVLNNQAIPAYQKFGTQLAATTTASVDPALSGVSTAVDALGTKFPAASAAITPAWTDMATQINAAKTGTIDPVFTGIQEGLTNVQGSFATGVGAIRTQWDGVRSATADPVRFTINSVFNDGLVGMWNSVSDLIGSKKMSPYVAKFASGGVLSGYTPGRDVHKFTSPTGGQLHLSGGEAIMRPEWTRAVGGPAAVDQMNRQATGGMTPRNFKGEGRYAAGGVLDLGYGVPAGSQISSGAPGFPGWVYGLGQANGVQPSTYAGHQENNRAEAGYAPNPQGLNRGIDWSGPVPNMQKFAEYLLGIAPRTPALEQIIWMNPETGQKIGWHGRSPDVGGGYFAGDYSGHQDHVHTRQSGPLAPGMFGAATAGMLGAAALGASVDIGAVIRGMIEPKAEEIRKKVAGTKFPGNIGGLPGQVLESSVKAITSQATKLAGNSLGPGAPAPGTGPGDAVERWRPMVIAALRRNGFDPNQRNQDLMLSQIRSESSGNPKAVQQVVDVNTGGNEAVGLLQIAKGTWPGVRDPSLPDDRTDPWASMNGALRYYRGKYGPDLGTFWGQGHGYDRGGIFENNTFGFNTSGKPEAVFTNKQFVMLDQLVKALLNPKMFARLTGEKPVAAPAATPAPATVVAPPAPPAPAPAAPVAPVDPNDPVAVAKAAEAAESAEAAALAAKAEQTPLPAEPNADTPGIDPLTGMPKDPIDSYSGPLAPALKQGKLIGQLGSALAQPNALAKVTNEQYQKDQVKTAKVRQKAYADAVSDRASKAATLRAEGKENEALALEKAAPEDERLKEMAGTTPGTQAQLATLADGTSPIDEWRKQTATSFQTYLSENWAGMAESVIGAGVGITGGGAVTQGTTINGNIVTNSWPEAQRFIQRSEKRKSRATSRSGGSR